LVTLLKNGWTRVLGLVVIQFYAGEYTLSVDRALKKNKKQWRQKKYLLSSLCRKVKNIEI